MLALNKNNFLRIYQANGPLSLPVIAMRDPNMYSPPIILVPGESYAIYMNSTLGIGGLTLFDLTNTYAIGASISSVNTTVGQHKFIEFNMPSVPDGVYKINLGGGLTTNGVEVISDINLANQISASFQFSHSRILGDFYYPYLSDASVKQKIRLRISAKEQQVSSDIAGYEETATGRWRNLRGVLRNYVVFETPDYTVEDHQAARLLSVHDKIYINGRRYIMKEDSAYKITPVNDVPISSGEFGLYDDDSTVQFLA